MGPLFKLLEASFELIVPLVVASMIDVGIENGDKGYVVKMCAILALLGLTGLISSVTAQFFAAKAAVGFATKLRHGLFAHVESLSFSSMDQEGTSTLITRMTSDINQVQSGVNLVLRLFLRSPFIVFGAMIMAFTVDVKAALIFVVVIPLLSIVVFGIMLISIPLFAKVQGRGIRKIREAGIEVTVGVLEEECKAINKRFFTFNTLRRPYILLKWCQSTNGFIDNCFQPTMLSTPFTQMLSHKLRAEEDAILVGHTTDKRDHPQLNIRHWSGKNPKRLVLSHETSIDEILSKLYEAHCLSLIVEGGAKTHQSFLERGLWDELRVETAPLVFADGTRAPHLPGNIDLVSQEIYDHNIITTYKKKHND